MKMISAANSKGVPSGVRHDLPREGSRLRELYDFFCANKGLVVPYFPYHHRSDARRLVTLVDVYGLDIRRIMHGQYCLVGEWCGEEYRDYVATLAQNPHKPSERR